MTMSLAFVVVSDGVITVVADAPLVLPADLSSAVSPDHSSTFRDIAFDALNVAVTDVTDGAFRRYQISTRLLAPLW